MIPKSSPRLELTGLSIGMGAYPAPMIHFQSSDQPLWLEW